MPLQFSIESTLVRVRATAIVREHEFTAMLSALADAKALRTAALFTFSADASLSEIDAAAMSRIRAHFAALLSKAPGPPVKAAWVTSNAGSAAVIRLWRAVADMDEALGRRIKIFAGEEEALAWLRAPAA